MEGDYIENMKKIALIGLYTIPNMGDKILCETSSFLTRNLNESCSVKEVDVCPRYKQDYKGIEHIKYRIARLLIIIGSKLFQYENKSYFRYQYEYFMWWLRLNRYYHKQLKEVDAIIFAGGGFIKFRTQGLNYYVEQIIKIAQKNNIPVMMNGVGIEGYSEEDIRCQRLKKSINSDCVKVITTRDDYETLKKHYLINPNTISAHVGDPALWIPECYGLSKNPDSDVIGINVIRGKIYKDYGNKYSYDDLKTFYKDLINIAIERKHKWVLFSNGMKSDQAFGRELLIDMGLPINEYLLPAPKKSEDLISMIGNFSCILGTRLHACITAYSIDVPVVGLIWNEKIRIFSDIIGKKSNFFEEHELNVAEVMDRMEETMHESYDATIRDHLKNQTKSYLNEFLKQLA